MNNKKFKRLILALKFCLLIIILFAIVRMLFGIYIGWNEVPNNLDHNQSKTRLYLAKEQISVIPLKDSVIYEGTNYIVTGVNAFTIQIKKDNQFTGFYLWMDIIKFILGFISLGCIINFLRYVFKLLNQFEKYIILERLNLVYINKAAYNLLFSGISANLFILIRNLQYLTWFHLEGYKLDIFNDFELSFILTALILLIGSWIVKSAIQFKEESDLTI